MKEGENVMKRRACKTVWVGNVPIGGEHPVALQSMTNTPTADREATLQQILQLEKAGCKLVRCTVNTPEAAQSIGYLREHAHVPLVADIHFDYRLALEAAEAGISKIRINPGNIGSRERIHAVAKTCLAKHIPIRIGINGGSLEKSLLARYGGVTPEALCESALNAAREFERFDFDQLVLSVKCSNVPCMIQANRLLAERCDYPLHLGVTETGTVLSGSIKSAVGVGSLLCDGIGDTVRVSLTADPTLELRTAKEILRACGRAGGIDLVSCPTCGRTEIDLISLAGQLQEKIDAFDVPEHVRLTVALMGCVVNGPGEAREADVGVAGGKGEAVLFFKGRPAGKLKEQDIVPTLWREIERLVSERAGTVGTISNEI